MDGTDYRLTSLQNPAFVYPKKNLYEIAKPTCIICFNNFWLCRPWLAISIFNNNEVVYQKAFGSKNISIKDTLEIHTIFFGVS